MAASAFRVLASPPHYGPLLDPWTALVPRDQCAKPTRVRFPGSLPGAEPGNGTNIGSAASRGSPTPWRHRCRHVRHNDSAGYGPTATTWSWSARGSTASPWRKEWL